MRQTNYRDDDLLVCKASVWFSVENHEKNMV